MISRRCETVTLREFKEFQREWMRALAPLSLSFFGEEIASIIAGLTPQISGDPNGGLRVAGVDEDEFGDVDGISGRHLAWGFSSVRGTVLHTAVRYANSIEIATATIERRGVSDSAGRRKKELHVYPVAVSWRMVILSLLLPQLLEDWFYDRRRKTGKIRIWIPVWR